MAKVTLKGFIEVPGSDLDGVQAELNTHRQLTLEEPGCITFKVTQDKTDPCRFDVYEEFIDRKAFGEHTMCLSRLSYLLLIKRGVDRRFCDAVKLA
ncbi:putative quinol monooxygenase [Halomonas sp. AOP27-A1-41]|uniref:putative quinol monooxygenase n=1 Tax=Halomonas sp. AOP27-A1-41 TaxID=3457707 RepID=UPI004033F99D